jgi:ubiquinone/menaquinone biosynthesis C-methylase UbiE
VIVDIGTGDGRFVYQSARENPGRFYLGIDPNVRPLEKISEKIHRKPAKGGAPNALFIQAAIEELPAELNGVADEIHVHFPWGSLLRAVATADVLLLQNLHRICAPGTLLEVVLGRLTRSAIKPNSSDSNWSHSHSNTSITFWRRSTPPRDSSSPNAPYCHLPNGPNSIPHGQNGCTRMSGGGSPT